MYRTLPYIIITLILLIALNFSNILSSQNHEKSVKDDEMIESVPNLLTFELISSRTVKKDDYYNQVILEVTMKADSQCHPTIDRCIFYRELFKLTDNSGRTHAPSAPPLFYIPEFQLRELVSSRALNKNQTETGQLYFLLPKDSYPKTVTYFTNNNQNISFPL